MIIYNVTTKTEHGIADAWIQWMQEQYIPAMIDTGCFTQAKIFRLIEIDDSDGATFAVQYHAADKKAYDLFVAEHAATMSRLPIDKWGHAIVSFSSVLEAVN